MSKKFFNMDLKTMIAYKCLNVVNISTNDYNVWKKMYKKLFEQFLSFCHSIFIFFYICDILITIQNFSKIVCLFFNFNSTLHLLRLNIGNSTKGISKISCVIIQNHT